MRRYLIGGRSVWGRERVKTIEKKGYFESAEGLLPLINNLSLQIGTKNSQKAGFCCIYGKNKKPKEKTRKLYYLVK